MKLSTSRHTLIPIFLIAAILLYSSTRQEVVFGFYEDWSKGICSSRWLAYKKQWGLDNNGCVPELIKLEEDVVNGVKKNVAVITAQGNLSESKIHGVKKIDNHYISSGSPKKVGALLTTTDYFASGKYEVVMKIGLTNGDTPHPPIGLLPCIFLFHYEEHYPQADDTEGDQLNEFDPQYQPRFKEKMGDNRFYSTLYSEIDAPEMGFEGDFSFGYYNTYQSSAENNSNQQKIPFPIPILDNNYHTYRLDWHTELEPTDLKDDQIKAKGAYYYAFDSPNSPLQGFPVIKKSDGKWHLYKGSSVTYFLDGKKIGESKTHVSPVSARLVIGAWFSNFAGSPDWDEAKIYISEVSIRPFLDAGDVINQPESYPYDGIVPPPYH